MGIFSSKRRDNSNQEICLTTAQEALSKVRIFLPVVAAGLDAEGFCFAQRAIGAFVAVAGWPPLTFFIYQLGAMEFQIAQLTSEDDGMLADRAIAALASGLLMKIYAEPLAPDDITAIHTVTCMLMLWWGLSNLAEPQHPVSRLMRHFGGFPFQPADSATTAKRLKEIKRRITPEAQSTWKQAEREMSVYATL